MSSKFVCPIFQAQCDVVSLAVAIQLIMLF